MYIMYVATEHQKYETYFASLLGAVSWSSVHVNICRCFQTRAIFHSACRKIVCTNCIPVSPLTYNVEKSEENSLVSLQNVARSWGRLPILIFYLIYMDLPHGVYLFVCMKSSAVCAFVYTSHNDNYVTSFQGSHTVWEREPALISRIGFKTEALQLTIFK